MLDAVARGAKVIQENNVRDTQLFDEAGGVDDPWKICRSHGAVDHRPGNAKASGNDAFLAQMIGRLAREFLDDAFELGELLACEALFEHGRERAAFFREKRQITLRPANVPCKDHLSPYPGLYLYFTSGAAITGCTTVCRHVRAEDRILLDPNSPMDIVARWRSWRHSRRRGWDPPATKQLRRCRHDRRVWRRRARNRSRASRRRYAWRLQNLPYS